MVPKRKIRLMTRLAIYDKRYGSHDKKKNEYFMWDYIYFKNFATRTAALCGSFILTIFYVLKKLLVDQVNVFELDLKAEGSKIGFAIICLLLVYTLIGTHVAKKEYNRSTGRLKKYFTMLDKVDNFEKHAAIPEAGYYKDKSADYNYTHNKAIQGDIAAPLPTSVKDRLIYTKMPLERPVSREHSNIEYKDRLLNEERSNNSAKQHLFNKYGNNNKR